MQKSVIKVISTNTSKISFTIDEWTSVANKSFYGIAAHYVDINFKLQSLVIDFVASNGRYTGRDIAEIFFSTVKNISWNKKFRA